MRAEADEPACPFCRIAMYRVHDLKFPRLATFLCYSCGFHPDNVTMEDKDSYREYQLFFASFRGILQPKNLFPLE